MIKLKQLDWKLTEFLLEGFKKNENQKYLCTLNNEIFVAPLSFLVKPHKPLKHNCSDGCLYIKPPHAKPIQVECLSDLYLIEN